MVVIVVATLAVFSNVSYGTESENDHSRIWSKMDNAQKDFFFKGILTGIQAMGAYANLPYEKMREFGDLRKQSCIEKDFDEIYSQRINIKPTNLFILSHLKCSGKITPAKFTKGVEQFKEK